MDLKFYSERGKYKDGSQNIRYKKAVKLASVLPNSLVLDVGCREGTLKKYLPENIKYSGIDIVPRPEKNIIGCDVTKGLPFKNDFFDYIFCLEVLEHLKNPFFVLGELKRIVKPTGFIIFSVPSPYHYREIIGTLIRYDNKQGHIYSFTLQNITTLLQFLNLELIGRCGTYFTERIPCNNVFLTRSIINKVKKSVYATKLDNFPLKKEEE